jgi:hypothetical protein
MVLALLAASAAVAIINRIFTVQDLPNTVLIATTAAVGAVVARRLPANRWAGSSWVSACP